MKIALILNDDFSMWHFRKGLLSALAAKGFDVCAITPPGPYVSYIEGLGVRHIAVPMERFVSPVSDIKLLYRLYKIFRNEKFDIVHTMTIKLNIYGTIAAKIARVGKIVGLVSGAGFVYSENPGVALKLLKKPVSLFYGIALHLSHKTWFQNPDDMAAFIANGLITREKGVLIKSGGINTAEYSMCRISSEVMSGLRKELNVSGSSKCVLMIAARMIWSKGVREFVDAVKTLNERFPDWTFIMVCPKDPDSPDSVPDEYLRADMPQHLIIIDYFRSDIINFLAIADILVLASYYREGVPRTLLEGLAMAKPIVTTDSVGCREVVEEGKNGFLVPVKDAKALAEKLAVLMGDDERRRSFGEASRQLAERCFDESIVVQRVMSELYGIG